MALTRSNMLPSDDGGQSTVPGRTRWREKLESKGDLDAAIEGLRNKIKSLPDDAAYHLVLTVEQQDEQ